MSSKRSRAAELADTVLRKIGFGLAVAAGAFLMFPGIVNAADVWEPDTSPGTGATFLTDGTWFERTLDAEGDEDWFQLNTEPGAWYSIEARPTPADEWVDTYVEVYNVAGTLLAEDDDSGENLMPRLLFQTDATGVLDVKLRGYSMFTTGPYAASATEVIPGEIAGRVTSPSNEPLGGVTVSLELLHDGIWRDAGVTETTADGGYGFTALTEGTYRVGFNLEASIFPPLYYPGVIASEQAERIELAWGDSLTGIDQKMQTTSLVSGTVLNWNGSQPLSDVSVNVFASTPEGFEKVDSQTTGASGEWATRLTEGTYRIEYTDASGVAVTTYHPDAATLEYAEDIVVGADGVSVIARMPEYANLTGGVIDTLTGGGVPNAWIDAYRVTANGLEYFDGTLSYADGTYEIGMLTGTYALTVSTSEADYTSEYSIDTLESSDPISVGPSGVIFDFELTPAAQIAGDVTDLLSETVVPNALVRAEVLAGETWIPAGEIATTDEEGSFIIGGLGQGVHRLSAAHPEAPTAWWGAPGVLEQDATTTIETVGGQIVRTTLGVSSDVLAPVTALTGSDQVAPVSLTLVATDAGSSVVRTTYRVDGVEWIEGTEVLIEQSGQHVVEFYSEDELGNVEQIKTADVYVYATSINVDTLAGDDRYETAVAVAHDAFPEGADTVVIASGRTWADGLSASALAGALDAPILLVPQNSVPGVVAGEIARLAPEKAWIIGGEGVVGTEIEEFLVSALGSVTRLGGEDRYATAALVAEELVTTLSEGGDDWDGTYILASGSNFPDALAVSPIAASMNWPIVLTGSNGLNARTATFLETSGAANGILLGGEGAIPDSIADEARKITGGEVTRVAGTDRYLTALAIAQFAQTDASLGTADIAVASGQSFPDALTSGIRQARKGSILVLTPAGGLHAGVAEFLEDLDPDTARQVTFVGGVAAVSQDARASVLEALER